MNKVKLDRQLSMIRLHYRCIKFINLNIYLRNWHFLDRHVNTSVLNNDHILIYGATEAAIRGSLNETT